MRAPPMLVTVGNERGIFNRVVSISDIVVIDIVSHGANH